MGTAPIPMHRYCVKIIINVLFPISIHHFPYHFAYLQPVINRAIVRLTMLELYSLCGLFLFSVAATKCSVPEISNATYTVEGNWISRQQSSAMKLHPHGTVLHYNCDQGFVMEGSRLPLLRLVWPELKKFALKKFNTIFVMFLKINQIT